MSKERGFLQLRRGLWEHVRDGSLTHTGALVYIYMLSQADTRTGIWKGCAQSLANDLRLPLSTAKYSLRSLDGRYIRRLMVQGRRRCYPILCHKFVVSQGPHVGLRLDALNSTSENTLRFFLGKLLPDDAPEVVPDVGRQRIQEKREEGKTPTRTSGPPVVDPLEAETRGAAFDMFWERWPRKQDKPGAQRAWMKIPIAEYPAIMAGLEKFLTCEQWGRGIIPHASTWLNNKRWQDEDIPQVPVGGANGRRPNVNDNIETTLRTMRAAEQSRPN
jgi:hypothetical protein